MCVRARERERGRKKETSHVNNSVVFGVIHPFALYKIGSAGMVRVSIQAVNLGTVIKKEKERKKDTHSPNVQVGCTGILVLLLLWVMYDL